MDFPPDTPKKSESAAPVKAALPERPEVYRACPHPARSISRLSGYGLMIEDRFVAKLFDYLVRHGHNIFSTPTWQVGGGSHKARINCSHQGLPRRS